MYPSMNLNISVLFFSRITQWMVTLIVSDLLIITQTFIIVNLLCLMHLKSKIRQKGMQS